MSKLTLALLIFTALTGLVATETISHAGPSATAVLEDLQRLTSERKFGECVKVGEAAAVELPEWTVIWHLVAECYAADRKPCEAERAVDLFLHASDGASAERIADARALSQSSHAQCAETRSGDLCMTAHDAHNWPACIEKCAAVDSAVLSRSRALILTRCYLNSGMCAEAKHELGSQPASELDPADQTLLASCSGTKPVDQQPPDHVDADEGPSLAPWVLVGAGAVATGVGLAFLAMANSDADAIAGLAPSPAYDSEYADLKSSHDTNVAIGYTTVGVGLAVVGVGVLFAVTAEPSARKTTIVPAFGPGQVGFRANLTF